MDPQPKRPNRPSVPPSAPLDKSQESFSCSYPDCDYKSNWEENVGRHEWGHDPTGSDRTIPCQVCPQVFLYLVSFLHHMASKHSNKLFCPWCLFLGEDLNEFKSHMLAHSYTFKSSREKSKGRTCYHCVSCAGTFTDKRCLRRHQMVGCSYSNSEQPSNSTPPEFRCAACSRTFSRKLNLVLHHKFIHAVHLSTTSAEEIQSGYGSPNLPENSTSNVSQSSPKKPDSFKAQRPKPNNRRRMKPKKLLLKLGTAVNEDGEVRQRASTKIDLRCANCALIFAKKATLLRHQKNICRSALLPCDKCSYKTSHAPYLRRHIGIHLAGKQLKCRNLGCYYKTLWTQKLQKHQRSCKIRIPAPETSDGISKAMEILTKEVKMVEGGSEYFCSFCSFQSKSRSLLKRHFVTHMGRKPLRCGRKGCEYEAKCSTSLRDHIRRDHSRKGSTAPLQTKEDLGSDTECGKKAQVNAKSSLAFLYCSYTDCGYKTRRKDLLVRHEKSHHQWRVQCRVCFKISTAVVGYLRHMSSQHLDQLDCAWCLFLGKDLTEFKAHILTHSLTFKSSSNESKGRTGYHCDTCSRTFQSKYHVRRHQMIHSDERPFICPNLHCHYKSRFASNLQSHQKYCRSKKVQPKCNIFTEAKQLLGSDGTLCGNKTGVDVDSSSMAFACMLCSFIGDSEASALKHSCQHKTLVIRLNRI